MPASMILRVVSVFAVTKVCLSDSWDVKIRLYRDLNCFERADDLLLLNNGCYANLYGNLSKALAVKIVGYDAQGKFDFTEYNDNCNSIQRPTRQIQGQTCVKFTGAFWARLTLSLRSSTCTSDCSSLRVAVQTFYTSTDCSGLPYTIFKKPLRRECMRMTNGTQNFSATLSGVRITQTDYAGIDNCGARGGTDPIKYDIEARKCYSIQSPTAQSFRWTVDSALARSWCERTSSHFLHVLLLVISVHSFLNFLP